MQNAKNEMVQAHVLVCLNTSAILTLVVDQNVFKIQTVIVQKHVLTTSVKIHVQEFVV
jgi:hypothetical protein